MRMNQRFGQLCSLVANMVRDSKRKPEPYSTKDFLPKDSDEGTDWVGMLTRVEGITKLMGGKDLRDR